MQGYLNISNAASPNTASITTGQRNESNSVSLPVGEVISATLIQKNNDTASLRTEDGFVFTASSADLRGEVGETLRFQVMKKDKNGLSLKQLFDDGEGAVTRVKRTQKATDLKDYAKSMDKLLETSGIKQDTQQEVLLKTARAIAKIQRAQTYLSNSEQKTAMAVLLESGLSLNKISFITFSNVMQKANKQPDSEIDPETKAEALKRPFKHREDAENIINSLHAHGLAINDRNINTLERVLDKLPEQLDDHAITRMIRDETPVTPEQLYISRYSSSAGARRSETDTNPVPDSEIAKRFQQENISDTPIHREAARFLTDNDLPLTRENIDKTLFLKHPSEQVSRETLLDMAAAYLSEDKNAADVPLMDNHVGRAKQKPSNERLNRVLDIIGPLGTDETAIRAALDTRPPMNPMEIITARRQLAEISLKLTAEAANRLTERTIAVDTEPLREAVRYLRQLEGSMHTQCLRMAGAESQPDAAKQMASLYDALTDIKPLTVNVHAGLLQRSVDFTITGIHETVKAARAEDGYDTFATVPSPRYGDSFEKVRGQFEPLLNRLYITPTSENLKASFILSKNNMDISWENIESVKTIDAQINAVCNNLHPLIAANMIKDGLQPMDMQVEKVLAYIRQFRETLGEDGGDKISRYIMEMEDDPSLDEDTRKGMIALYRMLHVIQKDGAAALGLAARQDTPLTLGALMETAKYFEKQKKTGAAFDRSVDDAFGHLERVTRPEMSIRQILETAVKPPVTHTDLVTDAFINIAHPSNLDALLNEIEDGSNIPLEDMPDMNFAESSAYEPSTLSWIQPFLSATPGLLHYLQSRNIPVTAGTVRALQRFSQTSSALAEQLDELDEETGDALSEVMADTDLRPLREGQTPQQVYARMWATLDDLLPMDATKRGLQQLEESKRMIELRSGLNDEGGFQLPIRVNGRTANLSVYVLDEHAMFEDNARILMALDTQTLGLVRGYFSLSDGQIDLRVIAESASALSALREGEEMLTGLLAEAGITPRSIEYSAEERTTNPAPGGESTPESPLSEHEFRV